MHCFDDRYAAPAAVAFLSMLEHGSPDYFYALYVVHSDISNEHQKMLQEIVGRFGNASLDFITPHNRIDRLFDKVNGKFTRKPIVKKDKKDKKKRWKKIARKIL